MSAPARGRRNPPPLPEISKMTWEMARKPIWDHLYHQGDAYDGLPAPHADTHLPAGDDPLQTPGDPSTIEAGAAADPGDGPSLAREDHVHPVSTGVAVALGTALAEGTGAALARADHVHKRATEVEHNTVLVATRRKVNFLDSATVTLTVTDNAGNDSVDVTPVAVAGGGLSLVDLELMAWVL